MKSPDARTPSVTVLDFKYSGITLRKIAHPRHTLNRDLVYIEVIGKLVSRVSRFSEDMSDDDVVCGTHRRKYKNRIQRYRDHIALVVNSLKHYQNRLSTPSTSAGYR